LLGTDVSMRAGLPLPARERIKLWVTNISA
jgi:hypothetical protein